MGRSLSWRVYACQSRALTARSRMLSNALSIATQQTWRFFTAPTSPRPIATLRIAFSLIALTQAALLSNHLLEIYGPYGYVQWIISEEIPTDWLPRLGWVASVFARCGIAPERCVLGLFGFYVMTLLGLLVGWQTRWMAVLSWLAHLTLTNSGLFFSYGVEAFVGIVHFYLTWMPAGASYSIDHWLSRQPITASMLARLSRRTVQIHLCIVYFSSGLQKLAGSQWRSGEALWRALSQAEFTHYDVGCLAWTPWIASIGCWSVLLIEMGYPFFIWPHTTRHLWIAAVIGLHVGIAVLMGLLFSATMIILTLCAFLHCPLRGNN